MTGENQVCPRLALVALAAARTAVSTHWGTASWNLILLNQKRYCPMWNDHGLAKYAVVQACDSDGRP